MLKNNIIAPSVLSMDYANVKHSLEQLENSLASWIHYDVMDGHFVPNISFGPSILNDLNKKTDLFMDVHLMIEEPTRYAQAFIDAGADLITFHWECFRNLAEATNFIDELHQKGIKVGITSKPATPIQEYEALLSKVDLVLVMSVEPGFGGQSFMEDALDKIAYFKRKREELNLEYLIEVDGGINESTGSRCVEAGCDVLVAGSYVFQGDIVEKVAS
ncbi:MAG TPA: ribulose-phosphate 3-epimerase, partial [Erysipelothrix sp.]|nr:ribulose-phosphate 3-epimerase [Erysipelothrix sp.]